MTLDVWDEKLAEAGEELARLRVALIERLDAALVAVRTDPSPSAPRCGPASRVTLRVRLARARRAVSPPPSRPVAATTCARGRLARRSASRRPGPHRRRDAGSHARQPGRAALARPRPAARRPRRRRRRRPGTTPVLLLDDVFSELDRRRADALLASLPPGQALAHVGDGSARRRRAGAGASHRGGRRRPRRRPLDGRRGRIERTQRRGWRSDDPVPLRDGPTASHPDDPSRAGAAARPGPRRPRRAARRCPRRPVRPAGPTSPADPLADHGRPGVDRRAGSWSSSSTIRRWATEWRYRQGEVLRRCDEALGPGVVQRIEVPRPPALTTPGKSRTRSSSRCPSRTHPPGRMSAPCRAPLDLTNPQVRGIPHRTTNEVERRAVAQQTGSYETKDMTILEGLAHVRKRPGMYIGGTGQAGLHHLVWEVVDNSVDEAMAGEATLIKITLLADGALQGRGRRPGHPDRGPSRVQDERRRDRPHEAGRRRQVRGQGLPGLRRPARRRRIRRRTRCRPSSSSRSTAAASAIGWLFADGGNGPSRS